MYMHSLTHYHTHTHTHTHTIADDVSINIFTEWENVESLDSSCVASVDEPKVFLDTNSAMMIRIEKKGCENGCAANASNPNNIYIP